MNGFTNSLLSVLLSWVRSLVGNLWSFAGSDGGGSFYNFMAAHWLTVVVVLCAGGFVVDRLIYLIRWRPYYVWGSKLRRLLGARHREAQAPPEPAYVPPQDSEEPPTQTYAPAGFAHPAAQEPGDELNLGDDWEAWEQEEEAVPPSPSRPSVTMSVSPTSSRHLAGTNTRPLASSVWEKDPISIRPRPSFLQSGAAAAPARAAGKTRPQRMGRHPPVLISIHHFAPFVTT